MATIPAVCPKCESQYQVDPALLGKRMRCPNSICRAIFEIVDPAKPRQQQAPPPGDAPGAQPPSPEAPESARPAQRSGSVADLVPLVEAEAAFLPGAEARPAAARPHTPPAQKPKPAKPALVRDAPAERSAPDALSTGGGHGDWRTAPPAIRGQAAAAVLTPAAGGTTDSPATDAAVADGAAADGDLDFSELEDDTDEAAATGMPLQNAEATSLPAEAIAPAGETAHAARRRSLGIMVLLVLILAGGGVAALYLVRGKEASDEAERFALAQEAYRKSSYAEAVTLLQGLSKDFPSSPRREEYRFLAALCDLRATVNRASKDGDEVTQSLERMLEFLETYKNEALLKDRHADAWESLERLTQDLVFLAESEADRVKTEPAAPDAEKALDRAASLLASARRAWAEAGKYAPPPGKSQADAQRSIAEKFKDAARSLEESRARAQGLAFLRGLGERPSAESVEAAWALIETRKLGDVADKLLAELKSAHRASVRYTPVEGAYSKPARPGEARHMAVAPLLTLETPGPGDRPPLVALARGVLYALDPQRGDIRWARRLGVDSRHLPLRMDATLASPVFLVAVSTDEQAILALDLNSGRELWRHALPSPCIASPIQVRQRLFVPMLSGRLAEIDVLSGRLWGYYDLGQPLVHGGVHHAGLLYLPASKTCLYVLDLSKRACAEVLYLRHAAGALQGAPLILAPPPGEADKPGARASLLLSLAHGDAAQLLRFTLPIESGEAVPAETVPLPSTHSFPPRLDGDRLAIAGDDGSLTLLAVRPRESGGSLFFAPLAERSFKAAAGSRSPALIVHGDARRWWVLRRGTLDFYQAALTPTEGLKLVSLWDPGLALGTPLHAGQAEHGFLFAVTQAPDEPACLATAIELDTGRVRWQRQLGIIAQATPMASDKDLLVHDARGLFLLAEKPGAEKPGAEKPGAGDSDDAGWSVLEARRLAALDAREEALWVPGAPAPTLLTWPNRSAPTLRAHVLAMGKLATRSWTLPAPPLGVPAWHRGHIIVPLADGVLVALGESGKKTELAAWRGLGVDEKLPGYVVSLDTGKGDALLAVTDGNRKVSVLAWSDAATPPAPRASRSLEQRITAPPTPAGDALAVADAGQQLHLLTRESLAPLRRWSVPGRLSAGPAVRGDFLCLVVARNRLILVDPRQSDLAGQHLCVAQIVGLPEMIDGDLVAADWSGRVTWLDVKAGLTPRRSVNLAAHVVPVATPTRWLGRLLLPLSDGALLAIE